MRETVQAVKLHLQPTAFLIDPHLLAEYVGTPCKQSHTPPKPIASSLTHNRNRTT